ncbi:MAG TPA: c-type cytochrome [Steroidobacteraceae bacterium]
MSADRPPIPAERAALDRPWRLWASVAVGAFVLVSLVLGFWIVPESEEPGFDPWAAICRSIGIPGYDLNDAPPAPKVAPPQQRSTVSWNVESRKLLSTADIADGAKIAESVCVACHGKDGIGIMPAYPNLTHQSAAAIFKQLNDYKTGARTGGMAAVMAPMVAGLTTEQMANVAAYYASLSARVTEYNTRVPREILQLIKIGSPARALPPCDSCHGVNMSGPEESPILLGQSPEYFEAQLNAFKNGERRNDNFGRMRIIARALTEEEIKLLARYYAP